MWLHSQPLISIVNNVVSFVYPVRQVWVNITDRWDSELLLLGGLSSYQIICLGLQGM